MPNIQKVDVEAKTIYGLKTRTKNDDEIDGETRKIPALWRSYYAEIFPTLEEGSVLYGVYSNYEYDRYGAYDLLVGSEHETQALESVTLSGGRYLRFPAHGVRPQAIVDAWEQVWAYFDDPSIDERRAYETDFERYISEDEAHIYIGVHYF